MSDTWIQALGSFLNRPTIVLTFHIIILVALLTALAYIKATWNLEDEFRLPKLRHQGFFERKRHKEDIFRTQEIIQGSVMDREDR